MKKQFSFIEKAPFVLWPLFLVVIALLLLVCEGDFLWKVQALNLHLDTPLFYHELMAVPGGLLSWAGTLFTEYFYHPWLGTTILCLWWLLLMWLVKRAFRIDGRWAVVTLIPVALILVTIVDMGYWVYLLKLPGHVFVTTLGTTVIAALLWGFRCLPSKYGLRTIYIVVTTAIGYPLLGAYALGGALVMGIWQWYLEKGLIMRVVNSAVALLSIWLVPLLCYQHVFCQVNKINIYAAGLPLYITIEESPNYYIPYYLLLLFFVLLAATYGLWQKLGEKPALGMVRWAACQVVLLAGVAAGLYFSWFKDENFHRELAMQHCIDRQDWQGVLEEAALQEDEPTRAIVMMRNLALCRLGTQGNDMFKYANGMKPYNADFPMNTLLAIGPMMYYQYGMLNYGHRFCMEMGVEYGWNPQFCELLAKCAVMNGEERLARKYIEMLKHTRYYADRAHHLEELLARPESIKDDPEMGPITHMLHYADNLTADQEHVERFIMRSLARSTPSTDPVFQEQQLIAAMWMKNWTLFEKQFEAYIQLHPKGPVPRHFQEAAFLYCYENDKDASALNFIGQDVKAAFDAFARQLTQYDGMAPEAAREALAPNFGKTYFFDFYLMHYDDVI